MNDTNQTLTLEEWRKRRHTQESFAKALGISSSTYNIWENNPDMIRPKSV